MSYLFDSFLLKFSLVLFLNTVITTTVEHTSGSINFFGPGWEIEKAKTVFILHLNEF